MEECRLQIEIPTMVVLQQPIPVEYLLRIEIVVAILPVALLPQLIVAALLMKEIPMGVLRVIVEPLQSTTMQEVALLHEYQVAIATPSHRM